MRKSIHIESERVIVIKEFKRSARVNVTAKDYEISKASLFRGKSKFSEMYVSQRRQSSTPSKIDF